MQNDAEPDPNGPSWRKLIGLLAILLFGAACIGPFHLSGGDTAAVLVGLGVLFRDWGEA